MRTPPKNRRPRAADSTSKLLREFSRALRAPVDEGDSSDSSPDKKMRVAAQKLCELQTIRINNYRDIAAIVELKTNHGFRGKIEIVKKNPMFESLRVQAIAAGLDEPDILD